MTQLTSKLFIDKDGLSVSDAPPQFGDLRMATSTTSYLIERYGQAQGSSDAPPQFWRYGYGQWDLSVNYDINENMSRYDCFLMKV